MRRRSQPEGLRESPHLSEALQVAWYHCILEMPLKSIAELMGKSPATITRRLDEVRKAGWLRDRPEFNPPQEIWKDLRGKMTCSNVELVLKDYFGSHLIQRVTVIPSPVRPGHPRTSLQENVERVGLYAADRLCRELVDTSHVVGMNWGWSVRQCVTNLHPLQPNPDIRFVPIVGNLSLDERDPHYEEAVECSSNRLSQIAASAFGSPHIIRLNTPAYIPRRFHEDMHGLRFIRDFIESDVSYRRIFGSQERDGLIHQMDTLVTGLTSLDVQTLPIYRPGLITEDDLQALEKAGVVGDLALHLLEEKETSSDDIVNKDESLVQELNDLIVGASPLDFIRVAEKARETDSKGPGVIVVAVGPMKARILITAIRLGAVNELITDLETAIAMGRYLGIEKEMKLEN
jgi:DNA-binding transcriptional regulator LsrR (DeoR family)